jgi:hypothetical protein
MIHVFKATSINSIPNNFPRLLILWKKIVVYSLFLNSPLNLIIEESLVFTGPAMPDRDGPFAAMIQSVEDVELVVSWLEVVGDSDFGLVRQAFP